MATFHEKVFNQQLSSAITLIKQFALYSEENIWLKGHRVRPAKANTSIYSSVRIYRLSNRRALEQQRHAAKKTNEREGRSTVVREGLRPTRRRSGAIVVCVPTIGKATNELACVTLRFTQDQFGWMCNRRRLSALFGRRTEDLFFRSLVESLSFYYYWQPYENHSLVINTLMPTLLSSMTQANVAHRRSGSTTTAASYVIGTTGQRFHLLDIHYGRRMRQFLTKYSADTDKVSTIAKILNEAKGSNLSHFVQSEIRRRRWKSKTRPLAKQEALHYLSHPTQTDTITTTATLATATSADTKHIDRVAPVDIKKLYLFLTGCLQINATSRLADCDSDSESEDMRIINMLVEESESRTASQSSSSSSSVAGTIPDLSWDLICNVYLFFKHHKNEKYRAMFSIGPSSVRGKRCFRINVNQLKRIIGCDPSRSSNALYKRVCDFLPHFLESRDGDNGNEWWTVNCEKPYMWTTFVYEKHQK